jgi:predicted SAM-dependent methyltransferase
MKKSNKKLTMINLGSGFIGHDDWINVDYGILALINKFPILKKIVFGLGIAPKTYDKPWPKNLRLINLRKSFPFADDTVDFIFTAHFIEHLDKHETVRLFKECYRSLKKGGTIRILVPDLDTVVEHYKKDKDSLHKVDVLNNHFWGVLPKHDTPPSIHTRILSFFARGHNWLYNYDYMKKILMLSGFNEKKIVKATYRKGKVPNIDFLDNHPDHSLIVEATK